MIQAITRPIGRLDASGYKTYLFHSIIKARTWKSLKCKRNTMSIISNNFKRELNSAKIKMHTVNISKACLGIKK